MQVSYNDPTLAAIYTDQNVSQLAMDQMQSMSNFVAGSVFPVATVENPEDKFQLFDGEYFHKNNMQERAWGSSPSYSQASFSEQRYKIKTYSDATLVSVEHKASDSKGFFSVDRVARRLMMGAYLNREISWVNSFFSASAGWGLTLTGATSNPGPNEILVWENGDSVPFDDIERLKAQVELSGMDPKQFTLTMGRGVYAKLIHHPDVIARLDGGQTPGGPAVSNEEKLAVIFGVKRVLVSRAVINPNEKGQAEDRQYVAGNHVLLSYSPDQAMRGDVSAGMTFSWDIYGTSGNPRIRKDDGVPPSIGEGWVVDDAFDHKQVAPYLGAIIINAVTPS